MTAEYAKQHQKEIEEEALSEAVSVDSVQNLSKIVSEQGGICYAVIDGRLRWGENDPVLDEDEIKGRDAEFARGTVFGGVSLERLISEGRVKVAMVPM